MSDIPLTIEFGTTIVNELTPECIDAVCHDFLCECATSLGCCDEPASFAATYDRKSGKIKLDRRIIEARIAKAMRAKRKA